jgi:hypothetical protein
MLLEASKHNLPKIEKCGESNDPKTKYQARSFESISRVSDDKTAHQSIKRKSNKRPPKSLAARIVRRNGVPETFKSTLNKQQTDGR